MIPNVSVDTKIYILMYFYFKIRNGGFSDSPFLGKGKYCENTEPTESFETISNYLYVKFSTLTHPLFNKVFMYI